ncbi:Cobyrinic acid a,c-diamide synthase domain protein [Candidatus Magnetobacterium bavaricum]|uniref:Cobyrinic acid a,c-diamide synthase domain protein n=1 Tax=Candidatus Magnetobacterium bavaricum TaxID=29290 RepID=A0A0F3GT44_9BACT|nr:Cobyrinic acid a,c-diamide synthase domain protein [Candidatus Magnetobacterium bavaricum]
MRKIAVINFKGGVGKTTITWLLGKYVSQSLKKRVLLFDIDAQMSLTQALTLNDNDGSIDRDFWDWLLTCEGKEKTICNAWQSFINGAMRFNDFDVDNNFIYTGLSSPNLHFVPAVEELYLEAIIGTIKPKDIKDTNLFITQTVYKIERSKVLKPYDYIFFDCPPSVSSLSFSVLFCADMLLIPINPDFYAVRGLALLLNSVLSKLKDKGMLGRFPAIAVLMNKAKPWTNTFTKETKRYFANAKNQAGHFSRKNTVKIKCIESFLKEDASIKNVFRDDITVDIIKQMDKIWREMEELF